MNLRNARRKFAEMRAAHTEQPEPIRPELTATQALTETETPTAPILADVLLALIELDANPLVVPNPDPGPAWVVAPNGRSLGACHVDDIEAHRAAGNTVIDPRESRGGTRPFTLPARPRQTFGDAL